MLSQNSYVEASAPRFHVETTADGQRIVVPAQRSLFIMLFMVVWLCAWTVGGVTAISSLFSHFQPFVAFWCCGWALGEAFAVTSLLWMTAGKETLRVVRGDLELAAEIPGFARRRLFKGTDIRGLSPAASVTRSFRQSQMPMPLFQTSTTGCVKFDYGARTIFVGVGLDEPEGRAIVDFLKTRLPKTATAQI